MDKAYLTVKNDGITVDGKHWVMKSEANVCDDIPKPLAKAFDDAWRRAQKDGARDIQDGIVQAFSRHTESLLFGGGLKLYVSLYPGSIDPSLNRRVFELEPAQ